MCSRIAARVMLPSSAITANDCSTRRSGGSDIGSQSMTVAPGDIAVSARHIGRLSVDAMTRTWFITGSSAGFGQAIAAAALDAGDNVVATARRPQTLEQLVSQAPERVMTLALDVTDQN